MESPNSCTKCGYVFAEIDPHILCKTCRQPDPQMFYCPNPCSACDEVHSCKPLEDILRKYELKKLAKKFTTQHGVRNKSSENHIYTTVRENMKTPHISDEEESNYSESLSFFEKRLIGKIMSKISPVTDACRKKSTSPYEASNNECSSLFPKISAPASKPHSSHHKSSTTFTENCNKNDTSYELENICSDICHLENVDYSIAEKDCNSTLCRFLQAINPDAFLKNEKAYSDDILDISILRLLSSTGEVLQNSTILSSPSNAKTLVQSLALDDDINIWPSDLKISKLLSIKSDNTILMRAHPKIRQMQSILFGELEASLPKSVISPAFSLPTIPVELQQEFSFAKRQLQRLLLMHTSIGHFKAFCTKTYNENVTKSFLTLLQNQIEMSLINHANFLGLLIQEIRSVLLKNACCEAPGAISHLIYGPVHRTHFFGSYVQTLEKFIEKYGDSYRIYNKSKDIRILVADLPIKCFHDGADPKYSLKALKTFFTANHTQEQDKASVLKAVMPRYLYSAIKRFLGEKENNFESLSGFYSRYGKKKSDFLTFRQVFASSHQHEEESPKQFADALRCIIPLCAYGEMEKEMLRDRFLFGLLNGKHRDFLIQQPLWSIEECLDWVLYDSQRASSSKNLNLPESRKRKYSEMNSLPHTPVKKVSNNKPYHNFLMSLDSNNGSYHDISNCEKYKEIFPLDGNYSFSVICPWTGKVLRQ